MAEYKNCYIAFFDILGFKSLITQKSCGEILTIFEEAKQFGVWNHKSGEEELFKPIVDPNRINIKIMSDSICIFIECQIPYALSGLISTCTSYQAKMLGLSDPILLRGGIVKGELYYDGDIIFGQGLTDAYLLESKNAKFPRVILTKHLIDECSDSDEKFKDFIYDMLFKDFDAFYSLNYIMEFCCLGPATRQSEIENTYKHIQDTLAKTTDDSIREKYVYLDAKYQYYYDMMKAGLGEKNA